jgi:hypothetical protein
MKKITAASILATGLAAMGSGIAVAATTTLAAGDTTITPGICANLSQNVGIKLSANNAGSFSCNTTRTTMAVGVCSTGGANKASTHTCTYTADSSGVMTVKSYTGCPAYSTNTATLAYTGRVAYVATSSGGAVAPNPIGAACTSAAVAASNVITANETN